MRTSPLTGLTEGDFTGLRVLSNGTMTDILTLISAGGGGQGVTDVTSQSSELAVVTSGTTRQLTLNLSAYAANAVVSTLLANCVLASAYNTAMAAKIDTLTAGANITTTGSGTSRTISATSGSSLALQLDGVAQTGATCRDHAELCG